VAVSFFQKIRLALRGWGRRRAEATKRRNEEFLRRNVSWAPPPAPAQSRDRTRSRISSVRIDREGLQVAFLDDSGRMAHYLDATSGDVVEADLASPDNERFLSDSARFRAVPHRTDETDGSERRAFVETMDQSLWREQLRGLTNDPAGFRRTIARDRAIERAWYNFKNDRASEAIEKWLQGIGLV
jgi:hypothetical protein